MGLHKAAKFQKQENLHHKNRNNALLEQIRKDKNRSCSGQKWINHFNDTKSFPTQSRAAEIIPTETNAAIRCYPPLKLLMLIHL